MIRIVFAFVLFVSISSAAQPKSLSTQTIRDFSLSFYQKHHYEKNDVVRSWAFLAGRRLGYSISDVFVAVEQLEKDNRFREELYKVIYQLYNYNLEILTLQLISIGMRATEAKKLAAYMFTKYEAVSSEHGQAGARHDMSRNNTENYQVVDQEASFVGGRQALVEYLTSNINYPDSAAKEGIEGNVVVKFKVGKDGGISDVTIKEGGDLDYGLPEEALRVVGNMPKWQPASIKGNPVSSYHTLPITFVSPSKIDTNKGDNDVVSKEKLKSRNKPRALMQRNQVFAEKEESKLFSGTKIFCDLEQIWRFEVNVSSSFVSIKLYPGVKNDKYKDKTKVKESIIGRVEENNIITKEDDEFLAKRFKYENGRFYQLNSEGGYNEYKECK